jgi:hypothetical protein
MPAPDDGGDGARHVEDDVPGSRAQLGQLAQRDEKQGDEGDRLEGLHADAPRSWR